MDDNEQVYCIKCQNFKEECMGRDCLKCYCFCCNCFNPEDSKRFVERPNYKEKSD